MKQNPFSLYDFLGYLLPGAIFLYSIIFSISGIRGENPFTYMNSSINLDKTSTYIPFVLVSYLLGHILSFISSMTIERFSVWCHGYPSKYLIGQKVDGFWEVYPPIFLRRIMRFLICLSILPVAIQEIILGKYLGIRQLYKKKLDKLLIKIIKEKTRYIICCEAMVDRPEDYGDPSKQDFFRFLAHYALENCPNHLIKFRNYIALYGFSRTISFVFVTLFWASISYNIYISNWNTLLFMLILIFLILSYIMFISFVKFYRRFTLEVFMAVSVLPYKAYTSEKTVMYTLDSKWLTTSTDSSIVIKAKNSNEND